VVIKHHTGLWKCRAFVFAGALAATGIVISANAAVAQGFFDFLFGGQQRAAQPPQPAYPPPPPEIGRVAPAPLGQERVNGSGDSTGHTVAFCVRLCDGQHFPMEQMVNGTPVETCRAICPYSRTKVFFGSEIGAAVAPDGQHYANLDTAFVYRKQLVANCTCNGRDAFGLATFDVKNDPTLRPGDVVSTKDGLLSFTGRSAQGAGFIPVNPTTLPPDIRPGSPQLQLPPSTDTTADEEGGTIVQPDKPQPPNQPAAAAPTGRTAR
jgi:Protein of unknown function (DUF2865)